MRAWLGGWGEGCCWSFGGGGAVVAGLGGEESQRRVVGVEEEGMRAVLVRWLGEVAVQKRARLVVAELRQTAQTQEAARPDGSGIERRMVEWTARANLG